MEKITIETDIGKICADKKTFVRLFGVLMDAMELNYIKASNIKEGSQPAYRFEEFDYETSGKLYEKVILQIVKYL